ncbi:hypothetical protein DCAR_0520488 [Daucus carota subsp. sativus]|uniref:Uncharacterized protein n=1 Tax=Daucus carota subsp. sativus TaxID=79200 RepID=A0A161YLZ5_DAUCS|nr:hypothetical protein DCAR_0520488 [Daucus carota subsp. sativus]
MVITNCCDGDSSAVVKEEVGRCLTDYEEPAVTVVKPSTPSVTKPFTAVLDTSNPLTSSRRANRNCSIAVRLLMN